MTFSVRQATTADLDELSRLRQERMDVYLKQESRLANDALEQWQQAVTDWIAHDQCRFLVADRDTELIGYMVGWVWQQPPMVSPSHTGMITEMSVDGHCKQGGVGTAMFQSMGEWFKEHKLSSIEIRVPRQHPIEQAFWRSVGAELFIDQMYYKFR